MPRCTVINRLKLGSDTIEPGTTDVFIEQEIIDALPEGTVEVTAADEPTPAAVETACSSDGDESPADEHGSEDEGERRPRSRKK